MAYSISELGLRALRMTPALALSAALAILPSAVLAENSAGATVGAIRWDAWVGATNTDTLGHTTIGLQVETALSPSQFHDRLPFYSVVNSSSSVTVRELTQTQMDTDIGYANQAGLNYWAFCYYRPGSGLDIARNLYFSSTQKAGLNYTYILGVDQNPSFSTLVTEFSRSYYQKVMNNRPLLYIFGGTGGYTASDITTLRSMTTAAGLGTPYIVVMDFASAGAAAAATSIGADAISAYTSAQDGAGAPYSTLMSQNSADWVSHAATGKQVVPWVATGWDNRPRNLNPETFLNPVPGPNAWLQTATAAQIGTQLQSAINWVNTVPTASDANTILMYAWNEFDEGGWLTPTLSNGPDRVNAISEVLKYASSSNWDPNYSPQKAFDNDSVTAWQAANGSTYNGQWLEVDFGTDSTFSQATLSEYGNRTSGYRIEYLNGTTWKTAYTGTTIGSSSTVSFPAVTGRKARMYFTSGVATPAIFEFSTNKTAAPQSNIALNRTYSSTIAWDASQTAEKAFDGNLGTNWQGAAATFAGQYLAVDFGVRKSFNTATMSDFGGRITGYKIEYWNGSGWSTAYTGGAIGTGSTVTFPTVTSNAARLYLTSGTFTPIIYELSFGLN